MNLRALPAPRHALLLLLSLSLGACAMGDPAGEEGDAEVETDTPTIPAEDAQTFDLVNPLDDVGEVDAGIPSLDVGSPKVDTGSPELDSGSSMVDAGSPMVDAGAPDAGEPDAGRLDVGSTDVGPRDSGATDAGPRDSGSTDAGGCTGAQTRCGAACVDLQTSSANCGSCGTSCGAGNACVAGRCATPACMVSASDCNMNSADGCELVHATALNTCPTADNMGSFCGDTSGGFLCADSHSLRVVATRTGNHSSWYRGRLNECSTICPASLNGRLTLRVPAGVDYDLFVYSACGRLIGSSQALAGITDQYTLSGGGSLGSDSFDFYVEVRWFSGASCMPYTLTYEARP